MFLKLYHKELIDSLMYTGAMQKKKKRNKANTYTTDVLIKKQYQYIMFLS